MDAQWDWTIGRVVAPFGIRGEMKTEILTDFPERFRDVEEVALVQAGQPVRVMEIQGVRFHKGAVLLKVVGVDTIEDVEALRGAEVRIKRQDAVHLPDGSYYVSDLIGMQVVTVAGQCVGLVNDVIQSPGHDQLLVGESLIPMVHAIVLDIDVAARRITVDPPDGLLPGVSSNDGAW